MNMIIFKDQLTIAFLVRSINQKEYSKKERYDATFLQ